MAQGETKIRRRWPNPGRFNPINAVGVRLILTDSKNRPGIDFPVTSSQEQVSIPAATNGWPKLTSQPLSRWYFSLLLQLHQIW